MSSLNDRRVTTVGLLVLTIVNDRHDTPNVTTDLQRELRIC